MYHYWFFDCTEGDERGLLGNSVWQVAVGEGHEIAYKGVVYRVKEPPRHVSDDSLGYIKTALYLERVGEVPPCPQKLTC